MFRIILWYLYFIVYQSHLKSLILRHFALSWRISQKKNLIYSKIIIIIAVTAASPSPGPMKMTPRMTTLHEENTREAAPLLHMEEEEEEEVEEEDDEHPEFEEEEHEVRKLRHL